MSVSVKSFGAIPSRAAVYAAVLSRPPVARSRELPTVRYRVRGVRVDARVVRRFEAAVGTGERQGPTVDRLASSTGFVGVHPGVLHTLAFPLSLALMARPRFPAPVAGLVHVRNSFLLHEEVRVGDELDIEVHAQNLRPHRRGGTFEMVQVFTRTGSVVAVDVSTYLARGITVGAGPVQAGQPSDPRNLTTSSRDALERLGPPTRRWKVGVADSRRFALATGDVNPLHVSTPTARIVGYSRPILHGMYAASRAFNELARHVRAPYHWECDFASPIHAPATVWLSGNAGSGGEFAGFVTTGDEVRLAFEGAVRSFDRAGG